MYTIMLRVSGKYLFEENDYQKNTVSIFYYTKKIYQEILDFLPYEDIPKDHNYLFSFYKKDSKILGSANKQIISNILESNSMVDIDNNSFEQLQKKIPNLDYYQYYNYLNTSEDTIF